VFDCLSNGVVFIFGSEKACSKIRESKVCGSASNRTMVNHKLNLNSLYSYTYMLKNSDTIMFLYGKIASCTTIYIS
jgi:hypothetical protein